MGRLKFGLRQKRRVSVVVPGLYRSTEEMRLCRPHLEEMTACSRDDMAHAHRRSCTQWRGWRQGNVTVVQDRFVAVLFVAYD